MSFLPEYFSETAKSANGIANVAQQRTHEALHAGSDYARQNPIPVVLGALAIGVAVGLLCGRRQSEPKNASQIARDLVGEAIGRLTQTRKTVERYPGTVIRQWAGLKRKLGW